MLNGGLGGEIVSQHNVRPSVPFNTLARCHLKLKVPAVMEIPFGNGWIIVSRIQIRGRLLPGKQGSLYQRRYDPVAERYFWNLIQTYLRNQRYQRELKRSLEKKTLFLARVTSSPRLRVDVQNTEIDSYWISDHNDLQYVNIDLGKPDKLRKIKFYWDIADQVDYQLLTSSNGGNWRILKKSERSVHKKVTINITHPKDRFYRIEFTEHGRKWGLSSLKIHFG
jgi:hypothetical protein